MPKLKTSTLTREQWLLAFADAARPHFKAAGAPLPKTVRASIGWPSKGQRSNVLGECWSSSATEDNVCEIFIRPNNHAGSIEIAGTLTHELVHAAVGSKAGHGPLFRKPMLALGFEGKMTSAGDGKGFREWAVPIVEKLGAFPGKELRGSLAGGRPKQTTRMIKLTCADCEWTCRTTQKHIEGIGDAQCPTGCGGQLTRD